MAPLPFSKPEKPETEPTYRFTSNDINLADPVQKKTYNWMIKETAQNIRRIPDFDRKLKTFYIDRSNPPGPDRQAFFRAVGEQVDESLKKFGLKPNEEDPQFMNAHVKLFNDSLEAAADRYAKENALKKFPRLPMPKNIIPNPEPDAPLGRLAPLPTPGTKGMGLAEAPKR